MSVSLLKPPNGQGKPRPAEKLHLAPGLTRTPWYRSGRVQVAAIIAAALALAGVVAAIVRVW